MYKSAIFFEMLKLNQIILLSFTLIIRIKCDVNKKEVNYFVNLITQEEKKAKNYNAALDASIYKPNVNDFSKGTKKMYIIFVIFVKCINLRLI